jgi:hypothetical protein
VIEAAAAAATHPRRHPCGERCRRVAALRAPADTPRAALVPASPRRCRVCINASVRHEARRATANIEGGARIRSTAGDTQPGHRPHQPRRNSAAGELLA